MANSGYTTGGTGTGAIASDTGMAGGMGTGAGGHHHGHHGHHGHHTGATGGMGGAGVTTGSTVDTPAETMGEKIKKHLPGLCLLHQEVGTVGVTHC